MPSSRMILNYISLCKEIQERKNMKSLDEHVSKNFIYRELLLSDAAEILDMVNVPSAIQWQRLEKVTRRVLQPVREEFGSIIVNSGFRNVKLCVALDMLGTRKLEQMNLVELRDFIIEWERCLSQGKTSYSNHSRGEAIDFKSGVGWNLVTIYDWIFNNCEYRELIFEYNSWIHVSYREGGNIKKTLLKDVNHHYKSVDPDYVKAIYGSGV